MKLKRILSLVLLTVYLLGTAGTALASMSCGCVAMKSRTVHVCCCHCAQHSDDAQERLSAPCCSNDHSTEVELYTGSSSDNGKITKPQALDVPALVAEPSLAVDIVTFCDKVAERRAPFLRGEHCLSSGLRAPPVLV